MNRESVHDPRLPQHNVSSLFGHPDEVVNDAVLSRSQKREILAHWISDAYAADDAPARRQLDSGAIVGVDEIMQALKALDGDLDRSPEAQPRPPRRKALPRWLRQAVQLKRSDDDDDDGPPPCPASAAIPVRMRFVSADGRRSGWAPYRPVDALAA